MPVCTTKSYIPKGLLKYVWPFSGHQAVDDLKRNITKWKPESVKTNVQLLIFCTDFPTTTLN